MAFRKSISQSELASKLTAEDREQHGTDYSASQGGWVKSEPKPTPAADKDSSGGRLWDRR